MLKKGDLILLVSVIALTALVFIVSNLLKNGNSSTDKIAEISQNEKIFRTIDLNKVTQPEEFTIIGKYKNVVRVEDGRIRFVQATCPDQVCVKTGWLQSNGDIAVCLPNHAIIKLLGKAEKIDIVSY